MTSRERVRNAIAHKEGELPITIGTMLTSIHVDGYEKWREYLNLPYEKPVVMDYFQQAAQMSDEFTEMFGNDAKNVTGNFGFYYNFEVQPTEGGTKYADEFGIEYFKPHGGYFYDPHFHPLATAETLDDIKKFKFPDPKDPSRIKGLRERVLKMKEESDKALVFYGVFGPYEQAYLLRGLENFFMDLIINKDMADYLLGALTDYLIDYIDVIMPEIGDLVDIINTSDDLGSTTGLLFSKEIYREMIKPYEKRIVERIKKHTSHAYVTMHSCGAITEVMGDIIDNGVDILNPVQLGATGMDSAYLKREFGKDICFWGGGCPNDIVNTGTPAEVKKATLKSIEDFSKDGGFIFASIHTMQRNMPPENLTAMYQTAVDFRKMQMGK